MGVFGGSFDPPHTGHFVAAQEVLEVLRLHKMLFVPARRSPHKPDPPVAPDRLRLEMLREAIAGDSRFEATGIELGREAPSYTVDTLRQLATEQTNVRLFLLMGADQWASFDRWQEPERIVELAELAVMSRAGDAARVVAPDAGAADLSSARVHEIAVPRIDVSSTDLRRRAAERRSLRYLVPDPVRRIIEGEKLYSETFP